MKHRPLTHAVGQRAHYCCEYCQMSRKYYPTLPFPIDHIVARQHGGKSELNNLAFSCLHCNAHKGPNIAGYDPKTGQLCRLFHPRKHRWSVHFRWKNGHILGRTAIGRTTVQVLDLNAPEFVVTRLLLQNEGWEPWN